MAVIDTSLVLSDSQAITVSAGSSNVIDLGAPAPWVGTSGSTQRTPILLDITEDFAATGSATLTLSLQSCAAADFGSGVVTHYVSDAIGKANLIAGANLNAYFRAAIPSDAKRYVRLYYTVATGPFTAGKIYAAAATAVRRNVPMP